MMEDIPNSIEDYLGKPALRSEKRHRIQIHHKPMNTFPAYYFENAIGARVAIRTCKKIIEKHRLRLIIWLEYLDEENYWIICKEK